jgi:hypothetical protein
MKNLWRSVCLVVFVTGAMVYALSLAQSPADEKGNREPASPYIVITANYRIDSGGNKIITGERIRFVKANGEWRQGRYDAQSDTSINKPDAQKDAATFASTGEGVFAKAPGQSERKFISRSADQQMQDCFRSEHCLMSQSTFVRTEQVAGLKVYVLRDDIKDVANPIEWVEQSYSPKTGYIPLRNVKHFRDGSEMGEEATKVVFQEVPEDLNGDLKKLPVKEENK